MNDDWGDDAGAASAVSWLSGQVSVFALPPGSRDAALVLTIEPNVPYTIVVSGKNGATGVALAEVYDVNALP